jgi:hypothetical protein
MGYGLRNVADVPGALAELRRVLRPGAAAAVLDFNNSQDPLVDAFQVRHTLRVFVGSQQWSASPIDVHMAERLPALANTGYTTQRCPISLRARAGPLYSHPAWHCC